MSKIKPGQRFRFAYGTEVFVNAGQTDHEDPDAIRESPAGAWDVRAPFSKLPLDPATVTKVNSDG